VRSSFLIGLILAITTASMSPALAAPSFTAQLLQRPAGAGSLLFEVGDSVAAGSGAAGAAYVPAVTDYRAARWNLDGTVTPLGNLPGVNLRQSFAYGSNAAGQSVGLITDTSFVTRAVGWASDGTAVQLGDVPGFETIKSQANSINNAGVAVGRAHITGLTQRAVRWSADGSATLLSDFAGMITGVSDARDINAAGEVVGSASLQGPNSGGTYAVRWSADGQSSILGAISNENASGAIAINEAGQAAGYSAFPVLGNRAVRWTADGVGTTLADLPGYRTDSSLAYGIDESGNVVGNSLLIGLGTRAVFWDANGSAVLLQELMGTPGWTFTSAYNIESDDRFISIVAEGANPAVNDGAMGSFLLTAPIPEPSTLALLGVTATMMLSRRRGEERITSFPSSFAAVRHR
jgi:hypothetical protein